MAGAAQSGTELGRTGSLASLSTLQRATVMAGNMKERVMAMPPARRRWFGVSALVVGAICAGMMWYAGQTDWRILFSGLDSKDVQQIAQELSAAGIPYQVTEDGGGVRVGSDQIDKARMEVATKGMPQSGRMGFELFDKPNWVGSEFDEKVTQVFESAGGFAPTVGIIGAVLGLIQVMQHLDNIDEVGRGIAVAFVATIYGVGLANLVCLPAAGKLRIRIREEEMSKTMVLEGVISILEGMNPRMIETKLRTYLHDARLAEERASVVPA